MSIEVINAEAVAVWNGCIELISTGQLKMRCERGFLVDIRKGDRGALAPEHILAAPLRTEAARKTDLAATDILMSVKMLEI